ncbi:MAG: hypothetical protein N3G21_11400 [Candidatus Hydrogenedentes bacterium]|nr:hypothetical protein [Candidatus Hydrogenedentota bacterium]
MKCFSFILIWFVCLSSNGAVLIFEYMSDSGKWELIKNANFQFYVGRSNLDTEYLNGGFLLRSDRSVDKWLCVFPVPSGAKDVECFEKDVFSNRYERLSDPIWKYREDYFFSGIYSWTIPSFWKMLDLSERDGELWYSNQYISPNDCFYNSFNIIVENLTETPPKRYLDKFVLGGRISEDFNELKLSRGVTSECFVLDSGGRQRLTDELASINEDYAMSFWQMVDEWFKEGYSFVIVKFGFSDGDKEGERKTTGQVFVKLPFSLSFKSRKLYFPLRCLNLYPASSMINVGVVWDSLAIPKGVNNYGEVRYFFRRALTNYVSTSEKIKGFLTGKYEKAESDGNLRQSIRTAEVGIREVKMVPYFEISRNRNVAKFDDLWEGERDYIPNYAIISYYVLKLMKDLGGVGSVVLFFIVNIVVGIIFSFVSGWMAFRKVKMPSYSTLLLLGVLGGVNKYVFILALIIYRYLRIRNVGKELRKKIRDAGGVIRVRGILVYGLTFLVLSMAYTIFMSFPVLILEELFQ